MITNAVYVDFVPIFNKKDVLKILILISFKIQIFKLCIVCLVCNYASCSLNIKNLDQPMSKKAMLYVQTSMFSFHAVYYENGTRIFINILWLTWFLFFFCSITCFENILNYVGWLFVCLFFQENRFWNNPYANQHITSKSFMWSSHAIYINHCLENILVSISTIG